MTYRGAGAKGTWQQAQAICTLKDRVSSQPHSGSPMSATPVPGDASPSSDNQACTRFTYTHRANVCACTCAHTHTPKRKFNDLARTGLNSKQQNMGVVCVL